MAQRHAAFDVFAFTNHYITWLKGAAFQNAVTGKQRREILETLHSIRKDAKEIRSMTKMMAELNAQLQNAGQPQPQPLDPLNAPSLASGARVPEPTDLESSNPDSESEAAAETSVKSDAKVGEKDLINLIAFCLGVLEKYLVEFDPRKQKSYARALINAAFIPEIVKDSWNIF